MNLQVEENYGSRISFAYSLPGGMKITVSPQDQIYQNGMLDLIQTIGEKLYDVDIYDFEIRSKEEYDHLVNICSNQYISLPKFTHLQSEIACKFHRFRYFVKNLIPILRSQN
jgi:hypothetical protein